MRTRVSLWPTNEMDYLPCRGVIKGGGNLTFLCTELLPDGIDSPKASFPDDPLLVEIGEVQLH